MFIPEERKQSTPTPVLFMKQNALLFPPLKSSFMYSLSEIAGCLEQFSHSARVCACVCVYVCVHWCVCSGAKLIFGGCLESYPSSALGEEPRAWPGWLLAAREFLSPYGVGASCYVDVERWEAQQEANGAKICKDICYLSRERSDTGRHPSPKIQMDTHASMQLCPRLCTSYSYCIC